MSTKKKTKKFLECCLNPLWIYNTSIVYIGRFYDVIRFCEKRIEIRNYSLRLSNSIIVQVDAIRIDPKYRYKCKYCTSLQASTYLVPFVNSVALWGYNVNSDGLNCKAFLLPIIAYRKKVETQNVISGVFFLNCRILLIIPVSCVKTHILRLNS